MLSLIPEYLRLSLFPGLFMAGHLAPLLIRITIGAFFIKDGYRSLRARPSDSFGWIHLIFGILLFIGLWTQLAALAMLIPSLYFIWRHRRGDQPNLRYHLLLIVALLTLLVLGPGLASVDLPF
jgi:hypothetical protein